MPWSLKAIIGIVGGIFVVSLVALARASKVAPYDNGPRIDGDAAKKLTPDWTQDNFRTLAQIAHHSKMDPADLLAVIWSESGGHPWAAYRDEDGAIVAAGLNQLTAVSDASTGLSESERQDMIHWSVGEQLPYVDKAFSSLPWSRAGRTYDHAGLVYEGNFAPSRMLSRGTSPDTVLFTQKDDGIYYTRNRGFDTANKGTITVGDLIEHIRKVVSTDAYRAALQRLRDATGDQTLAPQLPVG